MNWAMRTLSWMKQKGVGEAGVSGIKTDIRIIWKKYNIPSATWGDSGAFVRGRLLCVKGKYIVIFRPKSTPIVSLIGLLTIRRLATTNDPLWFDSAGVINLIKNSPVKHEVASHHTLIFYTVIQLSKREAITVDLAEVKNSHKHNLPLASFIFPRNMEGYHAQLKDTGFVCYRGERSFVSLLPGVLGARHVYLIILFQAVAQWCWLGTSLDW